MTMHCDHLQENSVQHIRQCLDVIGVTGLTTATMCWTTTG